jgi:predicted Ser/Thr protein kinase
MEVDADDGRIYVLKRLRKKFGDRFEPVDRGDRLVLIPLSDDPLSTLREEFTDVDESVAELRESAREEAVEDAGR